MEPEAVQSEILAFLVDELGLAQGLGAGDPLFTSGAVDSFELVQILDFLQTRFDFEASPLEVGIEHFDTVASMSRLVAGAR